MRQDGTDQGGAGSDQDRFRQDIFGQDGLGRQDGLGQNGQRSIEALMAELERHRGVDRGGRDASPQRTARRSYFYDAPDVSPRHVQRQAHIAMIAVLALAVLFGGWGMIALVHWLAVMLGSGMTPRLPPGTAGSITAGSMLTTLPPA